MDSEPEQDSRGDRYGNDAEGSDEDEDDSDEGGSEEGDSGSDLQSEGLCTVLRAFHVMQHCAHTILHVHVRAKLLTVCGHWSFKWLHAILMTQLVSSEKISQGYFINNNNNLLICIAHFPY